MVRTSITESYHQKKSLEHNTQTHTAYTIAKYNMAMCAVGMAEEYRGRIGFNNLWPRTSIATAAVKMLAGNIGMNASRNVDMLMMLHIGF